MKIPLRNTFLCVGSFIFFALIGFAQNTSLDNADLSSAAPSYDSIEPISLDSIQPLSSAPTLVFPADAATSRGVFTSDLNAAHGTSQSTNAASNGAASERESEFDEEHPVGGNITGLDTLPTFVGAFAALGGPNVHQVFPYIMIGGHPLVGGTTTLPAKITEVSLNLLNPDGSLRLNMPYAPFEDHTLDSPNFSEANYASGRQIQFGDAVQRAEFFHMMEENWHTRLRAKIVDRVTISIPRFVNVQLPDGTTATVQAYFVGKAPNGDPFVEVLDILFQQLNFNVTVNEINAGNDTTNAVNFNLYPNTYLFSIDAKGKFAGCCVLGFHTYVHDPTTVPEPRWVSIYASWISPQLFKGAEDVTALSHEISEAFNDPFINTRVPTWQFPNQPPTSRACQSNLETGDPVEVLPVSTVPIPNRERHDVFTFHPQTEALLQWFEMGTTSNAINGAFSFPDETALPHSAVPCPPPPPPPHP